MWSVIGHDRVVRGLMRGLALSRPAHAYLLVGPEGVGKRFVALTLAAALNCTGSERPCQECAQCRRTNTGVHSDVQVITIPTEPEAVSRKTIGIGQIKEMQQAAGLQPFEGTWKVFIIDEAEHLSADAANSLLKLLEEPPSSVCLILLAASEQTLLPTIRSRCQTFQLRPVNRQAIMTLLTEKYGLETRIAQVLAGYADGRIGWAVAAALDPELVEERELAMGDILQMIEGGVQDRISTSQRLAREFSSHRQNVFGWLEVMSSLWRDMLRLKAGCEDGLVNVGVADQLKVNAANCSINELAEAIKSTRNACDQLDMNVNVRLALDVLFLSLPWPTRVSSLRTQDQRERTAI